MLLCIGCAARAQQIQLTVTGSSDAETRVVDSIGYAKNLPDAKAIPAELNKLTTTLSAAGYTAAQASEAVAQNDSSYTAMIALGRKTTTLRLYLARDAQLKAMFFASEPDTLHLPYAQTQSFIDRTLAQLEKRGYALAQLKLENLNRQNDTLRADLNITLNAPRRIDDIVIKGYSKFPEGHKQQLKRLYRGRTFNQETVQRVYQEIEKFRFVKQTKYPEILFEQDSTRVYVYLEKANANSFDGYIGFSNDEEKKIRINGYADLVLNNILNTGENFTIYWKSDGKDQKTFNAQVALPYIFKSPFALKGQLNIFKQDSTFQNTRTAIDLGYFLQYNQRVYLGYQATESSDIQNVNTATLNDFKNAFVTAQFEYFDPKSDDFLFPEKTRLNLKTGFGSRNANSGKDRQYLIQFDGMHNLYLNPRNIAHLKTQNYLLGSGSYILNELYRFGGINSIRGFAENSLQGSLFTSLMTEYRYVLTPGIYAHSIVDYGYYRDEATKQSGNLLGLGFGFGLLTKNGLFNLVYANGSSRNQQIKLSNSIVHVSFRTLF